MTGSASAAVRPTRGGAPLIIVATAVAGIAGYAVTFLAFRFIGASAYVVFAAFWSAMYLIVGGLSGIQQEIARATGPIPFGSRSGPSRARNFAVVVAVGLCVAMLATAPLWAHPVFSRDSSELIWPLAVGTSAYVLVASLTGSLYGVSRWRSIFLMIVTDGLLRLVLVLVVLSFTRDIVWLAWAAALPFPLALIFLWRFVRSGVVGVSDVDVDYRTLSWNVARTVVASISTAALVSGFPLILAIAGRSASPSLVGHLIFAITITRAPLIVTVMSLQSYFIVRFRDGANSSGLGRGLVTALGALLAGGLVLAAVAWWVGPIILDWISGRPTGVGSWLMAILVVSSALVAALTIAGAAVLARARHLVYSLGWVAAALATIVAMSLPVGLVERIEWALLAGPLVGLAFDLIWLGVARPSGGAEPASATTGS